MKTLNMIFPKDNSEKPREGNQINTYRLQGYNYNLQIKNQILTHVVTRQSH
jgi:hypothetical protein